MHYKLKSGQNIVGIALTDDLRKYQAKHKLVLSSKVEDAQFLECSGIFYHDDWMQPIEEGTVSYVQISIIRITEEEYNSLKEAFDTNAEVEIDEPEEVVEEEVVPEITDESVTIEFIKSAKIKEMSNTCAQIITSGFDVELSDGLSHHFSLTKEDQINLITLTSMIGSGETAIPYHADDEPCKFYSVADILTITNSATMLKEYHTTYFNSLKMYIKSLETIEEISAITYGVEIPVEYRSDVLNALLTGQNLG